MLVVSRELAETHDQIRQMVRRFADIAAAQSLVQRAAYLLDSGSQSLQRVRRPRDATTSPLLAFTGTSGTKWRLRPHFVPIIQHTRDAEPPHISEAQEAEQGEAKGAPFPPIPVLLR